MTDRLSFDDEAFDADTITTRGLFIAVIALMRRMERLEIMVGEIINLTIEPYMDGEVPEEVVAVTLEHMTEFSGMLREELKAHHEIREHHVFLHQPE